MRYFPQNFPSALGISDTGRKFMIERSCNVHGPGDCDEWHLSVYLRISSTCLHPWYSWIHVVVVAVVLSMRSGGSKTIELHLSVYHPQIVQWPRWAAFLVLASDTRTRKFHRKRERCGDLA